MNDWVFIQLVDGELNPQLNPMEAKGFEVVSIVVVNGQLVAFLRKSRIQVIGLPSKF